VSRSRRRAGRYAEVERIVMIVSSAGARDTWVGHTPSPTSDLQIPACAAPGQQRTLPPRIKAQTDLTEGRHDLAQQSESVEKWQNDRTASEQLHQLRHSRLPHAVEKGASTPVLMKQSGHTSVEVRAGVRRSPELPGRHRSRRASPWAAAGRIVRGRDRNMRSIETSIPLCESAFHGLRQSSRALPTP
jgi:hypothetical protein